MIRHFTISTLMVVALAASVAAQSRAAAAPQYDPNAEATYGGVITQVNGTQLTLREADGRIQPISLSDTTRVLSPFHRPLPLSALGPKWHVVVTWPATGPAQSVDVEKIPRGRGKGTG